MVSVGVIISVYGRYNYISEAIESVLKQTLKPREVVVVADDPDRVPYRDRVYVVDRGRDRRYGPAILKGVDATTSDAIALLEDDDKFHPDKLRIVAKILERHSEITAVHNMQAYIDVDGKPIGDNDPRARGYVERQPEFTLLLNRGNAWRWFRRYGGLHYNLSSMVVRRSVFERHRLIIKDVELLMDFVLFTLSVHDGYYLHIPERLTIYRVGSGESTMNAWGDPVRVKRRLCVTIKNAHDYYILHNYVRDSTLKKLLESFMGYVLILYLLRPFVDCGVEIPLITTVDVFRYALKQSGRVYNLPSFINAMQALLTTLLGLSGWGRRWLANFYLRMKYGVDLASLIQRQRD